MSKVSYLETGPVQYRERRNGLDRRFLVGGLAIGSRIID